LGRVTQLKGIPTNLELCAAIAASEKFAAGDTTTSFLNDFHFAPHAVEVVSPGMNTTVQVITYTPSTPACDPIPDQPRPKQQCDPEHIMSRQSLLLLLLTLSSRPLQAIGVWQQQLDCSPEAPTVQTGGKKSISVPHVLACFQAALRARQLPPDAA